MSEERSEKRQKKEKERERERVDWKQVLKLANHSLYSLVCGYLPVMGIGSQTNNSLNIGLKKKPSPI